MPDHGARYTDQQIDEIEKRIAALYDTAYRDIRRKYLAFIDKFKRDDVKMRQRLADGEITKAQYDAWMRGQVFQGKKWNAQLSDIAKTLTDSTIIAADIANEHAENVFAMNANYATYEIEKAGNIDMGFGLYDEDAVRRLVRDNPALLPPSRVDIPREQRWNMDLINRQIGVGIVTGEGIEAIAKRLRRAAVMSANQARTHARTAMTGAQNAGRIEGYKRAEGLGIKLEKEWLATLDGHTRRSHAMLDGQHVPTDQPFKSLLGDIMYPGDPSARPANVYNCRCTLISHLLEHPSQNAMRRPNLQKLGDGEVQKPIKDMTYMEWLKQKQKQIQPPTAQKPQIVDLAGKSADGYTDDQRKEINRLLNAAPEPIRKLYAKYGGQLKEVSEDVRGGASAYYSPFEDRVHMKRAAVAAGDSFNKPFGVHFHEYGHNLDYLAGKCSCNWRSPDGKTFEDVIYSDWDESLRKFFGKSRNNGYTVTLENKMGWSAAEGRKYIAKNIERWRKANGLKKKDAKYLQMLDELSSAPQTTVGMREYWDLHFAELADVAFVDNRGGAVAGFCAYIKNNYSSYARADISDMFERYAIKHAGSRRAYPFGFGHGSTYAKRPDALAKEAFAEMSAATITTPESLAAIKEYLPNAYDAYLAMIEEVTR